MNKKPLSDFGTIAEIFGKAFAEEIGVERFDDFKNEIKRGASLIEKFTGNAGDPNYKYVSRGKEYETHPKPEESPKDAEWVREYKAMLARENAAIADLEDKPETKDAELSPAMKMLKLMEIICDLETERDKLKEENQRLVLALESAEHELTTMQGLHATDNIRSYGKALANGCDSNGAWDTFIETVFEIDSKVTLTKVRAALNETTRGE